MVYNLIMIHIICNMLLVYIGHLTHNGEMDLKFGLIYTFDVDYRIIMIYIDPVDYKSLMIYINDLDFINVVTYMVLWISQFI